MSAFVILAIGLLLALSIWNALRGGGS